MFSDASDDEPDFDIIKLSANRPSPPYLRLHEDDEYDEKFHEARRISELLGLGVEPERILRSDYYRSLKLAQFCDSIRGFHKGNLDLTGRHLPRYESLFKRWNAFLHDFINLSLVVEPHQTERAYPAGRSMGTKYIQVDYTVKDSVIWDNFEKKWHVSRTAGYDGLLDPVQSVLEQLSLTPLPKIQNLCLLDLPVEVLDSIFKLAALKQARLLSSTCRRLREIGKRYIFNQRTLTLHFPTYALHQTRDMNTPEERFRTMIPATKACRTNVIDQSKFLLSRGDLCDAVDSLSLANRISETLLVNSGLDTIFGNDFYVPVFEAFQDVICNCKNLRSLYLSDVDLSVEMLQAIASLPNLTVLDYHGCSVTSQAVASVFAGGVIKPSPSVFNLILLNNDNSALFWVLVALYPNLRTLCVSKLGRGLLEPSNLVSRHSEVFASLEKLNIGHVFSDGVTDLAHWITLNSEEAPLRLTHLKITAQYGLEDGPLLALMDALETAPLQVLVLDGIKEGSFELFDRIAARCPNLLGLTITRRENYRQIRAKFATWPQASYEYARHFSAFQRLEHFSWNFRVPLFDSNDQTPAGMAYFEDGFISDEEDLRRRISGEDSDDSDYFNDGHFIAYPFAAYCRTLKSFAVTGGTVRRNVCWIKRRSNQQLELVPVDSHKWYSIDALNKWDTPILKLHWPHVFS
ncbi:hypothetical protein BDQ17DRAFT_1369087 [Cyathus striatus]|nr:hypothetical protein BDQ17DRAFT_1369087 [Cyathus striatus]